MRRVLRVGMLVMAWLSVAAAVRAFYLPWATLDVKYRDLPGQADRLAQGTPLEGLIGKLTKELDRVVVTVTRGTRTVTGDLSDLSKIPTEVSGVQISQLANRQDVQVVLALAELLTGQRELGAKSYAVYLLPGLALMCGLLITLWHREQWLCLLVGILCLVAACLGFWKLLTTNTDTLLVAITIGQGLWLSLWAYVGLGLAAIILVLVVGDRRKA